MSQLPTLRPFINEIICGDAAEVLRTLPDNVVDLVVTSPPYDSIRDYTGFKVDLGTIGSELYRVMKDGAVAVVVMQDQTRDFGKSLTSFKTAIDWCDRIGFKLFETLIYRKHGPEGAWWKQRFRVDHEYMFVFLKGRKPKYFNKEPIKIPSKHAGKVMTGSAARRTDGTTTGVVTRPINQTKCPGTVWVDYQSSSESTSKIEDQIGECPGTVIDYLMAGDKNALKRKHPATFPDRIAKDMIQCFSSHGDLVLDPFVGSGTTSFIAASLGRKYLGIDISEEYCDLATLRLQTLPQSLDL
jgi:site-specific DNA-methyltransferase (adenine-specific)